MYWKLLKRNTFFAILAFMLPVIGTAQLNDNSPLPVDTAVTIGKLSNGLTYYIRSNKKPENKVELRLVLNAGSINEDEDQLGLAHMAEHMAFNGTKNFKKNEIVSFLQSIGVGFGSDLNASTSFDETIYILPIPTDKPGNLEKGFQILEDWAHNVTYLDEDIEDERAIILEESRLGKGAGERMFKKILPRLLKGSLYAERLPIGKDSLIRSFKPDVIRRFYKDWYRPDLMAVIVVGDISKSSAEALIKKHFEGLQNPANARPRKYVEVPTYDSDDALIVTDKEATSYQAGIEYPARKKEALVTTADYRSNIIKGLFTTMLNKRLQELTQQENPPFLYASASFSGFARGYENFEIFTSSGDKVPQQAITAAVMEVERVKRFGFTEAELDRAKKNLLASYERAYNDRDKTESDNFVEEYIGHFLNQEPIPGIAREFELVQQFLPGITLADVNAIAEPLKQQQNLFSFVMGPDKDKDQLPAADELLQVVAQAEKSDLKPYEEKAIAAELLSKTPKAGKVVSKKVNAALGTTELVLSNGVTVTLKSTDFKNDQILMAASRYGGTSNYGKADKYNAHYALSIVNAMGFGSFSPTDLQKAMAGKAVSATPFINNTSEGINGVSTVKDLESMFQLAYLKLTEPRTDSSLFASFIQKNKAQLALLSANPQAAFIDTAFTYFYKNDPLAPIMVPKPSYFDSIQLSRAQAIYQELLSNVTGMHFVFTGNFKEADIIPLIEKYIAALPASGKKPGYVDQKVRPIAGNQNITVYKGEEQKSLIISLFHGSVPYSEDLNLKASAVTEVLNIRIIEELREKIQGIYGGGIYGELEKAPYPSYQFVLQLPCGPEKVDTLLKAVDAEIKSLVTNGPSKEVLDKVKQQWLETHKVQLKENGAWSSRLLSAKVEGSSMDRFVNFENYVKKLTIQDVQAAAKLLLNNNNRFTAILMPADAKK